MPKKVDHKDRYYRHTTKRPAADDWYPCHVGGLVELSTMQLSNGLHRVCVWGADDFGMDRDFTDKAEADEVFAHLNTTAFIDRQICAMSGLRCV